MRIKTFVDGDLRAYSTYDTARSIPRLEDGMKPSQRKCLYGLWKRGEHAPEIKVAQLSSYCAEHTDYHHGEGSLASTIVGMAQSFAGSNNANLMMPNGQFGSRLSDEAGAPRYIFTELSPNFRKYFRKEDDVILKFLESDGQQIEPEVFISILPMVLINGTRGMGTGYACMVLNYSPEDIRDNILAVLDNKKKIPELVPYFNGFKGIVSRNGPQTVIEGKYEITNTTTIKITELPVGTFLDSYIAHLNKLEDQGLIKSYDDNSTEDTFEFVINAPRSTTILDHDTLMQKFKLISRDTENLTLWNQHGKIQEFENVQQIVNAFVEWRLERYEERRLKLIELVTEDSRYAGEKARFIEFYLANTAKFRTLKKPEALELLQREKFTDTDIPRLMALSVWSFTGEEIDKLRAEIKAIQLHLDSLNKDTAKEMYRRELKEMKF